jgi:hypothetical protein
MNPFGSRPNTSPQYPFGMRKDNAMTGVDETHVARRRALAAMLGMLVAIVAAIAPALAYSATGDDFGLAAINDPLNGAQTVPALPDASHAFWAGTCDIAGAPAPPSGPSDPPVAIPGGIGGIPPRILAPDGQPAFGQTLVTAPPTPAHCIDWGSTSDFRFAGTDLWSHPAAWRLPAQVQAGGHPDGTATFTFHRPAGTYLTDGAVDNIYVDLPAGFVGDPNAVPKCSAEVFAVRPLACPEASQVGVLHLELIGVATDGNVHPGVADERIHPVFNLEPRKGNVAELGFGYASTESATTVRIVAKARTNGDFGVTTFVGQIPAPLPVRSQQITLWGVPWAAAHDRWRAPTGFEVNPSTGGCNFQPGLISTQNYYVPTSGFTAPGCATGYEPGWGAIKPFISNLTECTGGSLSTRLSTDSYQNPGLFTSEHDPDLGDSDWKVYESPAPASEGCGAVPFEPAASFELSSTAPDSASGLSADIEIPANDEPPFDPPAVGADQSEVDDYVEAATAHWNSDAGRATSHLDRSVVELPEGMSVNPSGATGLLACSDAQIGLRELGNPPLFNNAEPTCPDGSRIGTVTARTPVLDEPLTGEVILGEPKSTDPASGEMVRLFLVLRNHERGLLAKVYGSATADPSTGRLVATFDKNPRVPVEDIEVEIKGGQRGMLATPRSCGQKTVSSVFTPWSAAHDAGGTADAVDSSFAIAGGCSPTFGPSLAAGMSTRAARSSGAFSFRFARPDGQQHLRGLTANLPKGLLASVKDLPLCSSAQAAFEEARTAANIGAPGGCPASSKIGVVDAKAGAGDPFVLERKGEVFLTEGYKGGPYGLLVKVRGIAGPFRGARELDPIVVRQSIRVDRATAQVSAVSDPFPLIHHGVPLRVREVTVLVNRAGFMLNPSDCASKQVAATLTSDQAKTASPANPFAAAGCAGLPFKPKLTLQLTGRKQTRTGKHPGVKAVVKQAGVSEAGIERAEVRLPKSLALDPDNAQALCEFVDGTKPDLENHCPAGSIVGRARAVSPLLNDPLVGNVYFVKNVRRSSTGNLIRTLPMIVVALRGEIAVNLKGESNTTRSGKLVNTFDQVPDAPITQFNLNIKGGNTGILAVTRTRRSKINLCATGRQIAEADIDGHNGRRADQDVRMKTPCPRKAKRAKGGRRR